MWQHQLHKHNYLTTEQPLLLWHIYLKIRLRSIQSIAFLYNIPGITFSLFYNTNIN